MCAKTKTNPSQALNNKLQNISTKTKLIIGVVALLMLCSGGLIYYYIEKHALQTAVTQLNLAINTKNLSMLTQYINFKQLGDNFAQVYGKTQKTTNTAELREVSDKLQELVLAAIKNEEPPRVPLHKQPPPDTVEPPILPKDFIAQLEATPLKILEEKSDYGVLGTKIIHPELNYEVLLKLYAQNTEHGWEIIRVNAPELVKIHMDARNELRKQRIEDFHNENMRRQILIDQHIQVMNCQIFLAQHLQTNDDVPMVISMDAVNIGQKTLIAASVICMIENKNHQPLAKLPLSLQPNALPSGFYTQHWQINLSQDLPETKLLLRQDKLFCTMQPVNVSLSDGKMIYQRPETELINIRP